MRVGIIDYGAGNLRSVHKAVETVGFKAELTTTAGALDDIEVMILPGQGSFGDCVQHLHEVKLFDPVKEWLQAGRPYFGICLGYQILFEESEESPGIKGFNLFPGKVVRFPAGPGWKVPHMGWNEVVPTDPADPLWEGLGPHPHVYFVHSYYPDPQDPVIEACRTAYAVDFVSGIRSGNVVATQFHPEKSQDVGLRILRNFLESVSALAT